MWWVFTMARVFTFASQAAIVLMGILIAGTIGLWQLSGQKTPSDIFGAISNLAIIGTGFVFVLFISRIIIDGRDEYESDRNKNALWAIGDCIGEGEELKTKVWDISPQDTERLQVVLDEIVS